MKSKPLFRAISIGLIIFSASAGIDFFTGMEINQSLRALFYFRGLQKPSQQVVVIALDEKSESLLAVGQDLTHWRSFHAGLIRKLQEQGAMLIIFDLQFLVQQSNIDSELAQVMKDAGNILVTDCVQKFLRATEDFYGRDECSESQKEPIVTKVGQSDTVLSRQLVAMRKISPVPQLAESVLDHAPFVLINDPQNSTVREVWTFYDGLAETPSLPVVTWLYYLQRTGAFQTRHLSDSPISRWLTERRRECLAGKELSLSDSITTTPTLQNQLIKVICDGNSRYLDFYGPPQTVRMESYSDVYQGKVTDLQNKVVFVGKAYRKYSSGKTDFFQTPFTDQHSGKMAGVEIMATQFANLLEDRFIESPLPPWVLLASFGLILSVLLTYFPGLSGLAASLLFTGIYMGVTIGCFSRYAWWLPLAVPLFIQLPLSWLLSILWSRRDLLHERKRILSFVRQVFPQWTQFLPAPPGQWYPEKGADYLVQERHMAGLCLATDIEGYTAVAAQHTPQEMWKLLKSYYQVLGHPVSSHHGVIGNIQGDAMMALWIDSPHDNQHLSACLAALEIEQAVDRFNETSNMDRLPTRIGLHEGDIVLGSGESAGFRFYNPFGDTVNTASRIQGVNKFLGTKILASNTIAENLATIVYRPVGRFRVEGRKNPLNLVEIVGKHAEVGQNQVLLHREFALGLELFQQGNWSEAVATFDKILQQHGKDNPTKYYLKLALAYQKNPPVDWDGIVTLQGK